VIDDGVLDFSDEVSFETSRKNTDLAACDNCETFEDHISNGDTHNSLDIALRPADRELHVTDDGTMEFSDTQSNSSDHYDLCDECGKFQDCTCCPSGSHRSIDEHSYAAASSSPRPTARQHRRTGVRLTRKRTRNVSNWKSIQRKKLRQSGKTYITTSGKQSYLLPTEMLECCCLIVTDCFISSKV